MKVFNIRDYGARFADTLQTKAIQDTIDACFLAGGGRVVVPCGIYLTGGIRLRSNVQLYLESGAILKGSRDPMDYMGFLEDKVEPVTVEQIGDTPDTGPTVTCTSRWNNAVIRAIDAHDISIIGEKGSYIDGSNCYDPEGESTFRGPHGIDCWRCENLHFEGYTVVHAGNWAHAIFRSRNITVRNVSVYAGHDGVDVRSCDNVLIEDCTFNTGDDCVAGLDLNDAIVRNCILNTSTMPMRLGGNNILVENCISDERNFGGRTGLSREAKIEGLVTDANCRHESHSVFSYFCDFRFNPRRPAEKIVVRNCRFDQHRELIRLEFTGRHRWCCNRSLRHILFENCTISDLIHTGMLWGDAAEKVTCHFKNVKISCREGHGNVPMLAAGNFEKIIFENCAIEGYDTPIILVGTEGGEVVNVNSTPVALRESTLDECLEYHTGGIAWVDKGKNLTFQLKEGEAGRPPLTI